MASKYEVVVSNVGTVYGCDDEEEVKLTYWMYVEDSLRGYGRAAGEEVYFLIDDEISLIHTPPGRL